jgi:hypothetical protein
MDAYTIRRKHLATLVEDTRQSVRFAIETCERLAAEAGIDLNATERKPLGIRDFTASEYLFPSGSDQDVDYEDLGYPETHAHYLNPDEWAAWAVPMFDLTLVAMREMNNDGDKQKG